MLIATLCQSITPVLEDCFADNARIVMLLIVIECTHECVVLCFEGVIELVNELIGSIEETFKSLFTEDVQVFTNDAVVTFIAAYVALDDRTIKSSALNDDIGESFIIDVANVHHVGEILAMGKISQVVNKFVNKHVFGVELLICFIAEDCTSDMNSRCIDYFEQIAVGSVSEKVEGDVLDSLNQRFLVAKNVRVFDVLDNVCASRLNQTKLMVVELGKLSSLIETDILVAVAHKIARLEKLVKVKVVNLDHVGGVTVVLGIDGNALEAEAGIDIIVGVDGVVFGDVEESLLKVGLRIRSGDLSSGCKGNCDADAGKDDDESEQICPPVGFLLGGLHRRLAVSSRCGLVMTLLVRFAHKLYLFLKIKEITACRY